MQVLVVGAGVGGLALAGLLGRRGLDPVVVDPRDRLVPRGPGGGVVLPHDGLSVLRTLGVADEVREAGRTVDRWTVRAVDGSVRSTVGGTADGTTATCLPRGRLLAALRGVVPPTRVRLGVGVESIDRQPGGTRVEFTNGVREPFDVVVGADGRHSRVRRLTDGTEATFCNTACWTVPADRDAVPDHPTEVWGPTDITLRSLPFRDGGTVRLTTLADAPGTTGGRTVDTIRRRFADVDWLVPDLLDGLDPAAVGHGDDYRVATDTWADGRVALLGDAAHARHPLAGLDATLALEDAAVLAHELTAREDAVCARLADYVGRRRSRVRRLGGEHPVDGRFAPSESPLLAHVRDALAVRARFFEALVGERSLETTETVPR